MIGCSSCISMFTKIDYSFRVKIESIHKAARHWNHKYLQLCSRAIIVDTVLFLLVTFAVFALIIIPLWHKILAKIGHVCTSSIFKAEIGNTMFKLIFMAQFFCIIMLWNDLVTE